jgi:tetratricopeptide (TPR) repeat protein
VGGADIDERKRQLLQHLNSNGKYHTFKEQLKHAVVGVVRERYGNRTGFSDSAHCHAFLSSLYTFLSDQLHGGLHQATSLDNPPETTPTPVDFDLLKHFATEAEDFQDYQLAERYYQERVAGGGHVGQYWYDYGVFCLLIGQLDKAEQCLKEAIALDQKMIPALLLFGMLSAIGERFDEGSEVMELATISDPSNIIAWCMRGLFYEMQTERVLEEMCYEEAVRVWRGRKERTYLTIGGGREEDTIRARDSHREGTREEEEERDGDGGEREATTGSGPSTTPGEQQDLSPAEAGGTDEPTASSKVEVHPEATPTTEAPPTTSGNEREREDPRSAVFLQTASFLLDVHALKFAEMCLGHVATSSSSPPPSLYHLLVARLHLHRGHYPQARDCLTSALQTDIQSSWAWSLLGHTHYQLGEFPEAQQAFERCLLLQTPPPNQHSALLHLAHILYNEKKFSQAKEVYLRACRASPSGLTWRGVGVACYKMGELGESETALCEANILNNTDPLTWAYLTLVCLKVRRSSHLGLPYPSLPQGT